MNNVDRSLRILFAATLFPAAALAGTGCHTGPGDITGNETPNGLRYERTVYLEGLDQEVRVVKSPVGAYAIDSDGVRRSWSELVLANHELLRQRPRLTHGLETHLKALSPNQRTSAFAHITIPSAQEYTQQLQLIKQHLNKNKEHLEQLGLTTSIPSYRFGFIKIYGTADQIRRAGTEIPTISHVLSASRYKLTNESNNVQPTDFVHYNDAPSSYGGLTQTIGILEPATNCAINDTHPAFTDVIYSSTPDTCVAVHATHVASIAAQVAPLARIARYVGPGVDEDEDGNTLIDLQYMIDAYDWFVDIGAKIVNQSFRANPTGIDQSDAQGIIEEEVARVHRILVVQSAGNGRSAVPDSMTGNKETACPYNFNALCVGSHNSSFERSCYSSWRNYGAGLYPDRPSTWLDREEPDLLAFGGEGSNPTMQTFCNPPEEFVRVASHTSSTWAGSNGTSMAAPSAAGAAALLRTHCLTEGHNLSDLGLRAVLMAGAEQNVEDWRYSTRKPSVSEPEGLDGDWKDGAGALMLTAASAFCVQPSTEGPHRSVVEGEIDMAHAVEPPNSGNAGPAYEDVPPGSLSIKPNNQQWGGYSNNMLGHKLQEYFSLAAGDRIRAVLSWNGCKGPVGPSHKGRDLDLALYSTTREQWLYASLSNADNNEGFDVLIPSGWEGDFEAYVIYDPIGFNAGACDQTTMERYAFATSWGIF